jgi:integrase
LNKAAREVIEDQKSLKEDHPWVLYFGGDVKENWWSIRKLIWKACDDAKIERVTPHTLRHTFASHCAMAGVDLRTLAELLGHKTLDMVMRYSHLSPEHKAAAVALLDDIENDSESDVLSSSCA